jgi:hypothetical protein
MSPPVGGRLEDGMLFAEARDTRTEHLVQKFRVIHELVADTHRGVTRTEADLGITRALLLFFVGEAG